MVEDHYENGKDSGVQLQSEKTCVVLTGKNWKTQPGCIQGSIVFIDAGNRFITLPEFASAIWETDNYYVIVTREGIPTLPCSVKEIYGIRNSGKYGGLKQTYNELYQIYGNKSFVKNKKVDIVITEDSKSGFQFFDYMEQVISELIEE